MQFGPNKMDSDDDFLEVDKPASGSGKGPPPVKKTKLTPGQKMRRSRAAKSEEKGQVKKKPPQTAAERMRKGRADMSEEKKTEEKAKDRKRKAEQKKNQSEEKIGEQNAKNKERMATSRAEQSEDKRQEVNTKARQRAAKQRTKVVYKEALNSQEIMDGSYPVFDLKDTDDSIGEMSTVCQYCNAFKFKKETASTCCNNGKVILEKLPQPPEQINKLWHDETPEGRLFRQNARSINNAVCLTSIKGKQRSFGGGPSNVVYHHWKEEGYNQGVLCVPLEPA